MITNDCLRAIYKFWPGFSKHAGNKPGIAEGGDYLYRPDLELCFKNFTVYQVPTGMLPDFISIDGGKHSNLTVAKAGEVVESAVDFQMAYSIIWPQDFRLYQVGDGVNVNSVGTFDIFPGAVDASYCTYDGGDDPRHDPHVPDSKKGGYKDPLQRGGAPLSKVIFASYGL